MSAATDVTVILDRSGSMESIATDVIGSFNVFLATQQRLPGECRLSLVQFDDEYEVVYAGVPIGEAPRMTDRTFVPRGMTALLDAIGRTIDATGRRLAALPEAERPGTVLVAIITDGLERELGLHPREGPGADRAAADSLQVAVPVPCRESGRDCRRRGDWRPRSGRGQLPGVGGWHSSRVGDAVRICIGVSKWRRCCGSAAKGREEKDENPLTLNVSAREETSRQRPSTSQAGPAQRWLFRPAHR